MITKLLGFSLWDGFANYKDASLHIFIKLEVKTLGRNVMDSYSGLKCQTSNAFGKFFLIFMVIHNTIPSTSNKYGSVHIMQSKSLKQSNFSARACQFFVPIIVSEWLKVFPVQWDGLSH